ncbi:MAG: hypothetical protein U1F81_18710 [Verrucomicrobiaceae bacterium]|jgi:hypothetical protein
MSEWIKQLIESKRAYRAKLAALPVDEKIQLLEKLRQRTLAIRAAKHIG